MEAQTAMITESIVIALITGGLAVISNVIIAFQSNSKTIYRIDQLEKKVEKHNQIVERMTLAEEKIKVANHRIEDLEEKINV